MVAEELPEVSLPCIQYKEVHIWDEPLIKLYTNNCVRFPIRARSGNQYVMIEFHCDSNTIIYADKKMCSKEYRIAAYNSIMEHITSRDHNIYLQVMDNEASADYKKVVKGTWKVKYQLVPPMSTTVMTPNVLYVLSKHISGHISRR